MSRLCRVMVELPAAAGNTACRGAAGFQASRDTSAPLRAGLVPARWPSARRRNCASSSDEHHRVGSRHGFDARRGEGEQRREQGAKAQQQADAEPAGRASRQASAKPNMLSAIHTHRMMQSSRGDGSLR